jgi:hypothetical protein
MYTTLNHIEEVGYGSKEYTPIEIYMDTIPNVYIFKDTTNKSYTGCVFHFVKSGVQDARHTLVLISNHSMVADAITKLLVKKELLHKVQYMLTKKRLSRLTFNIGDIIMVCCTYYLYITCGYNGDVWGADSLLPMFQSNFLTRR